MLLKRICTSQGKTFKELARESDVSLTYLYELERGAKSNPSLDILMRLAEALGVSVQELIERS